MYFPSFPNSSSRSCPFCSPFSSPVRIHFLSASLGRIRNTEDKTQKLTSSRLVIRGTDRSDGGVYQCNATNKWGHDYSLIQLIVKGSHHHFLMFSVFLHLELQTVRVMVAAVVTIVLLSPRPDLLSSPPLSPFAGLHDPVPWSSCSSFYC